MTKATAWASAVPICEALGLDPTNVSKITLRWQAGEVHADVEMWIEDDLSDLVSTLKHYTLVERDE